MRLVDDNTYTIKTFLLYYYSPTTTFPAIVTDLVIFASRFEKYAHDHECANVETLTSLAQDSHACGFGISSVVVHFFFF